MGMVVSVLSGKGGTGKTSLCAGLAGALSQLGKSILCVDLDIGLRNLDIALGMSQEPALSFLDVCSGAATLEEAATHPRLPGIHLLTAPVGCAPEDIDPEAFGALIKEARGKFDYCLLDAPAGVGAGFRLAAEQASLQLLVTGPDPGALRDGNRTVELLELMGKQDVRLIVNRVNRQLYAAMSMTIDDVMDLVGCGLLGLVPEDPSVTLAAAGEMALGEYTKKGAAAALKRIARRLEGQRVPLKGFR